MVSDSSPAPSTPGKTQSGGFGFSYVADNPTTTPAGPPPSSVASFTPAGAPTDSFMGSSMMLETGGGKSMGFGSTQHQDPSGRQLFSGGGVKANAPLGKPIGGSRGRQPSSLSQQFSVSDEAEQDMDAEGEGELPQHPGNLFRRSNPAAQAVPEDAEGEDVEAEIERFLAEEMEAEQDAEGEDEEPSYDEQRDHRSRDGSEEGEMFLNMRHDDRPYGQPIIGEADDLIMLNTPGATDRVRREAESIFRRSSARLGPSTRARDFQFAAVARDIYTQYEPARITEAPEVILKTEGLVCRLYDEGIGAVDDAEKMDNSLANIAYKLVELWNDQVENLPQPEGEDFATIGPGPEADPFEKASYVAHLALRMHHTRFPSDAGDENTPPLPETLFNWMQASHNLYPEQVREISRYKPSPACHNMYWQTLRNTLLRGDVSGATQLLKNAGWENVRKGTRGDRAYTGKALDNVRRFAKATCEMLEKSPAMRGDWEIWSSSWTLFRVQARGSLDRLTLFAEGRDVQFSDSYEDDFSPRPQSMSTMARKASSQIPWDFYENLQTVYGIVLGNHESIMDTAQDWCEATVGLFGWWDDGSQHQKNLRLSQSRSMRASSKFGASSDYFNRLSSAFHLVVDSDMRPNPLNAVEVAIASAFEGNINAVVSLLRMWSLPVASSVAEVASLGEWLPPPENVKPLPTDTLDMDDLALLGMLPPSADEMEGVKDTTLVMYARELAGIEHLSTHREGWEIAIQVLGRMDVPENSEETVGELLRDLLATLDVNSRPTVDRMWRILNDLGMIIFAEETAQVRIEDSRLEA